MTIPAPLTSTERKNLKKMLNICDFLQVNTYKLEKKIEEVFIIFENQKNSEFLELVEQLKKIVGKLKETSEKLDF